MEKENKKLEKEIEDLAFLDSKFKLNPQNMSLKEYQERNRLEKKINELKKVIENKQIEKTPQEASTQQKSGIPHIIIGKPKEITISNQDNLFNPKQQDLINKLKKWGLILAVMGIAVYAIYRVLA